MKTFLVTGGAGFIGSNIVNELLNRGHNVRILDDFSTGKRENITEFVHNTSLDVIEGDIRNLEIVRSSVKGVDYIFHQGALPSVPRSIADPISTNNVNVLGTLNLLEAAKEFSVKRVVYASSSSVYGNTPTLPKEEDMPVNPLSPYAISKYTAERYCQIFFKIYGLETVCLRYFNVFGPKQDPTSQYSAVIPKFIKTIKEGKKPIIYGNGEQSRDFTYVTNNVEANILSCEAEGTAGEVFNIACGNSYTLLNLVEMINKILGTNTIPIFEKEREGDVKHSLASIRKASRMFGYKPVVEFEDGLRKTIEYFIKN